MDCVPYTGMAPPSPRPPTEGRPPAELTVLAAFAVAACSAVAVLLVVAFAARRARRDALARQAHQAAVALPVRPMETASAEDISRAA